jgi:hypothetical protein
MTRRLLPVLGPSAVARPEAEGWTRRFLAAGDRLVEANRLYEELGFQIRLEPPGPTDLRKECGDCRLALEQFRVIYTRRPS